MTQQHCIIIGGSHAGSQLAIDLRKNGWQGEITLISDENSLPYHRPPLSKAYLSGEKNLEQIAIRPAQKYEKESITIRLNTEVTAINQDHKTVSLDDGSALPYTHLALTTGAQVRRISIEGSDLNGVHYLRDISDVDAIKPYCQPGNNAVIVGGGYIGLETAAVMRKMGMNVTLLEAMPRILQRVTTEDISAFYHRVHSEEGVNIVVNSQVESFKANGNQASGNQANSNQVSAVQCADGNSYDADVVIVGIGVIPNTALAESIGLDIAEAPASGIVVDEFARTSNKDIVAAGDCTWHHNPIYQRDIRLESVQNANDQASIAAKTLCGHTEAYHALPWFWSDQYDLKLQIAGLSQHFDRVIIYGDIQSSRRFSAFYIKDDKLIAVDAVNQPQAFMFGKQALINQWQLDVSELEVENIDFKQLIQKYR